MNCEELSGTDDPPLSMVRDWLLAQYEEIEEAAREAAADDVPEWTLRGDGCVVGADPRYRSMIVEQAVEPTPWQREHMVLNDPRAVLADIAAKRDIVENLCLDPTPAGRRRARWVVLRLAAALAHRPGYQSTWQPAGSPGATARVR